MTSPSAGSIDADSVFGTGRRRRQADAFAELLRTDGVAHGHLGPREVERLWPRHMINSALVTELLPDGASVVDLGSGAGLPGIPMAIRRPDLSVTLLEPMQRRVRFLTAAVDTLGLSDRVSVERGRAEEPSVVRSCGGSNWVVARAVAPLDRLVRWALPLMADGGWLLALKGERADAEVAEHRSAVGAAGGTEVELVTIGSGGSATRVVRVRRGRAAAPERTMR